MKERLSANIERNMFLALQMFRLGQKFLTNPGFPTLQVRTELPIMRWGFFSSPFCVCVLRTALFIIYKVMKYKKILMKYNVYFIFSLVKI